MLGTFIGLHLKDFFPRHTFIKKSILNVYNVLGMC